MTTSKKPENNAFGIELLRCLSNNGISQASFASSVGYSAPYVSQIVGGERLPSEKLMAKTVSNLAIPEEQKAQLYYAAARTQWPDLPELDLSKK